MSSVLSKPELRANPEFQSAIVRLSIWLFLLVYIGLGAATEYYQVRMEQYYWLFFSFLVVFLGLFLSVLIWPVSLQRQYFALGVDISATSFSIFLTQNAISPIFLLYIWIFVSYGTRYGKAHLRAASLGSILAYTVVIFVLGAWKQHAFEAFFFLFLLAILPLYQYSLLKKLHLARAEAEAANSARGRFLANMTHELRTPLAGVIGMARLMKADNLDQEQKHQLNAILSSADKLESLIGDVLDFSRIDAEKIELENIDFDIRKTVIGLCREFSPRAMEKSLELICDLDRNLPLMVRGDQLRFSQILSNLIGNAVKFTETGEVIVTVRVSEPEDGLSVPHLYISVTDTGIGIPEKKLETIFDAFQQADDTMSRRFGGAGLGTAIAYDLTVMMGGKIDASSQYGRGSKFRLRLPILGEENLPAQYAIRTEGVAALIYESNEKMRCIIEDMCESLGVKYKVIQNLAQISLLHNNGDFDLLILADTAKQAESDEIHSLLDKSDQTRGKPVVYLTYASDQYRNLNRSHRLHKPFSVEQFAHAIDDALGMLPEKNAGSDHDRSSEIKASGVRILVAEDDPISAELIDTLLTRKGHEILVVSDGQTALKEARSGRYDLAFVDLSMPYKDGLTFIRELRSIEVNSDQLPVIALTANASDEVRKNCLDAGMNEFLTKPVKPEKLQEIVKRYT